MTNVVIPNFQTNGTDLFNVVWKLTRAMKKAGWIYKSSSNTTTKDTSGIAANDLWGGNADPTLDTYPTSFNATITTTSTGSQTLPLSTFNSSNPITAGFPASGTFQVLSSTGLQTITYTGTTTSSFTGCTGGTGTVSASTTVTAGVTSTWWNAQGPSTLKIPINAAQTPGARGNFIRGENITQATTGAQGELLGYLFDGYPSGGGPAAGYLVVAPRVDGIGADPHGWDHTHVITGNISGASITPSATIIEFVREVVFWKTNNTLQGAIYNQCVDNNAENSSRFSVLAANANCTNAVAPGGSVIVGNTFPAAGSFVVFGTGGANLPSNWFQAASPTSYGYGRALFIATPASYSSNSSADGSFTAAVGSPYTHAGAFVGIMFMRVDSQEDGDVDPYIWFTPSNQLAPGNTGSSGPSRTTDTSIYPMSQNDFWYVCGYGSGNNIGLSSQNNIFKFWRRRGWNDANDAFSGGTCAFMSYPATGIVLSTNGWDREKIANSYIDTYVLEDTWCVSYQTFQKTRKGICRWLKAVQMGTACELYGNKSWIQLGNPGNNNGNTINWSWVVGPWDGVSAQTSA